LGKQFIFGIILILLLSRCSSNECLKTITTPAYHIGGGYYPAQEREVPCDYDPGQIGKLIDSTKIQQIRNN
jgi:hypothetical protein